MASLSTNDKALIQGVIDYMQGNYEKPLDATVIQQLAKVFEGKGGFRCGCGVAGPSFRDSLRDAPFSTLLSLLLSSVNGTL
jgi:hypothetical protein